MADERNPRHQEALLQLLTETAQNYVDHQEDELGRPVLKGDYFWGVARHFITTLVALAADEAEPTEVVASVMAQVQARALSLLEQRREEMDDEEPHDG